MFLVATTLLQAHNVYAGVAVEEAMVKRVMLELERGYVRENPYHNHIHAADVVQSTAYLISQVTGPLLRPR